MQPLNSDIGQAGAENDWLSPLNRRIAYCEVQFKSIRREQFRQLQAGDLTTKASTQRTTRKPYSEIGSTLNRFADRNVAEEIGDL